MHFFSDGTDLLVDLMRFEVVNHAMEDIVLDYLEVPGTTMIAAEQDKSSVEGVCKSMSVAPNWAIGRPLRADGYECGF